MYCIGAVVPSIKSCGFAAPIFSKKKEKTKSSLYFVRCDYNNRIIEFVKSENLYSTIYFLNDDEIKQYKINDYSPVAFVYAYNGVNQVLVRDQNIIKEALMRIVRNNSVSVPSRYKALKYIGTNEFPSNLVSSIYLEYYKILRKNSQRFADDWKKKILQNEGINLDGLLSSVSSKPLIFPQLSSQRNIAFCSRARKKTFPQRRHRFLQSNTENQDENSNSKSRKMAVRTAKRTVQTN